MIVVGIPNLEYKVSEDEFCYGSLVVRPSNSVAVKERLTEYRFRSHIAFEKEKKKMLL